MIWNNYLKKEYWDKRASSLLNQNVGFSKKVNRYMINRKISIAEYFIKKYNPQTILDSGCGSGGVLIPLAKRYSDKQFYGVDFSPENLKQLKKKMEEESISNIRVFESTVWNLPLESDFIYCFDVLFHLTLDQVRKTLNEFERASKNYYANFRGEDITNAFFYDFLFKFFKIPKFLTGGMIVFLCKRSEAPFENLKIYKEEEI